MCILGEPHSHWNHYSHPHDPRDLYPLIHPRGWTWHIYRQESKNQRSIFWGFEFRESVFFWVLVTAPVFFGVVTVFFWVLVTAPVFFGVVK